MLVADLIRDQAPTSIGTGESVAMALRLMRERAIRHLPVVATGKRVVGLLSERDVLRQQVALGSTAANARTVREAMVPSPIVVRDDEDAEEARRVLVESGVGCLPVVDAHRQLIGVVTRTDLLRAELPRSEVSTIPPDTARMIMRRAPLTASASDMLLDAVARMDDRGIRHLPVVDGDHRVVGMLSDRDVRLAVGNARWGLPSAVPSTGLGALRVSDIMSREPFVLREDAPFLQVVSVFTDERVGAVPVVDADERLIGIVSYVDVLRNAGAL
jgi:CBS-domain-containing membrane protein